MHEDDTPSEAQEEAPPQDEAQAETPAEVVSAGLTVGDLIAKLQRFDYGTKVVAWGPNSPTTSPVNTVTSGHGHAPDDPEVLIAP